MMISGFIYITDPSYSRIHAWLTEYRGGVRVTLSTHLEVFRWKLITYRNGYTKFKKAGICFSVPELRNSLVGPYIDFDSLPPDDGKEYGYDVQIKRRTGVGRPRITRVKFGKLQPVPMD